VLKTVKQACKFNSIVTDYRMADAIENLADLITDEGDGREFFARNYMTSGMEQLVREGMLRLSGQSDQAVFELNQAMGGGKTHLMIGLGLLARHEHLRTEQLPADLAERVEFSNARIAAFNGRNNPDNFVWGDIATQLGEAEAIKPYWADGPKSVDQAAWKKIIGDKPTLILLDELPPYLENASTRAVGDATLATMVTYSLSCLMSAALELPNCCIVIANLSGSYAQQTKALQDTISNLQQETRRQSLTITPVQLAGSEIYEIIKKRLIDELPDDSEIDEVAEEYAQKIKQAEDGGYIVASSIEQITDQIRETYPFHPSFKHIVALFKENEGFRQTRGLMQFAARLLKSVDERKTDDVFLIGAQHLNLNDNIVKDEIERISPTLRPAITRDIADDGNAISELIDDQLNSDAAEQVSTLLLASSLSRAVGAKKGLTEAEIIEFLAAPNRKPDEFQNAIISLKEQAWYFHREDQRYFIKDTENLSRQIERSAKTVPQPKIDQALINRMLGILAPNSKKAYQDVQVMPTLDDLKLSGARVLIVVKPDGGVPPAELSNFFDYQQEKNNLLVLTGEDSLMADAVEGRLRELYAVEKIFEGLKNGDTLFEDARDRMEQAEDRFSKALSAAFNKLYFPGTDAIDGREILVAVTIDNGLKMGEGQHSAEYQLEQLLGSPRANYKLALDMENDILQYFAMAEGDLWPGSERRTPWRDVVMRAKANPAWSWMPGANGMETLKAEALKQGRWRLGQDGYIEKGPFPQEKTAVNPTLQTTNAETGESTITLTPRNCGDSPVIHVATTPKVSASDPKVEDLENFTTTASTLYFLAVDPTGTFEPGSPQRWVADLKIQHQIHAVAGKRQLELKCVPAADIYYTLDGSNPKDGAKYEGQFDIDTKAARLLVYAESGEATKTADFQIPDASDKTVKIDDVKPARISESKKINLDSTEKVFGMLNKFSSKPSTLLKGVTIQIGEGEKTVSIRFQDREITAAVIEGAINTLRELLEEDQAEVTVNVRGGVAFETGFDAKEFAEATAMELLPGDVIQQ
jgi:hypothetical protein